MRITYNRLFSYCVLVFFLAACKSDPKQTINEDTPRRIELLFLGHSQEHHNSRAYLPILASGLTQSGINITYTENLNDLNVKTLDSYDGLIVYANHESIGPAQEKALLNFVSDGNAFIPIHSASFCFKNSQEYIELVGGQFKDHGTATFTANITDNSHPSMQSVEEFSTWDETYVHDKISEDIVILMERVDGDHREPWTWVKEYGKGKVFYTAYGHDERTWTNPGFQKLIRAGILWAVKPDVRKNWEQFKSDIPLLAYQEMANIPNYEKRDPAPKYQMPLSPEESKKLI
ncbi:MAG: ThuA domain-containing protein, partial [Aurantibacter sp.]